MQLFTRRVHLVGPPADTMAYATGMRDFVAERTGRDIALWSGLFGGPMGTMFYAMRVDGLADLAAATASLAEDPDYHRRLAEGRDFVGAPAEDSLATPIHGELGEESPPVGSYAQIVTATIANGMYERALGWGAEMAAYTASLTGVPEMFLAGQFGAFGNVSWIGVSPDAATVDRAMATVNGDPEYMKRLGEAGELFAEGSGLQALLTRIA